MRTYTRFGLLATAFLIGCIFYFHNEEIEKTEGSVSYWSEYVPRKVVNANEDNVCSMQTCFNFTKCSEEMKKIYVLPNADGQIISPAYKKILSALRESPLYTDNPAEACLFVLSIDTTDRDRISENYVGDLNLLIDTIPPEIWNKGRNFVVFNLYHGTFPDYADHNLGFNIGNAIIARASPSVQSFRYGFDVSFPLFHGEHDLRTNIEREMEFEPLDDLLVSFKGKRYVYGIGSETRDSLHHLHNGKSIAMVTTCKHNNDWKEHQDSRCEEDNIEYEKWDYISTMANSTFCLTPRGRRLGSFRFLEALKIGCIPVVLSDDWVLPFAEIIDWSEAAIIIAEDNVLLVSDLLYSIPPERIVAMKQMCYFLYNRYFRDVESITLTTMQIILDRVRLSEREEPLIQSKITHLKAHIDPSVFLIIKGAHKSSNRLQHLVSLFVKSMNVEKVSILWPEVRGVPPHGADFGASLSPEFYDSSEFYKLASNYSQFSNMQIIFADELIDIKQEDVDLLKYYAKYHADSLIGFNGIDVNFQKEEISFSKTFNVLYPSLLSFDGRYIRHLFTTLPQQFVNECPTAAINIIMSTITMRPPIVLKGQEEKDWMHIRNEGECWKMAATRWNLKPPLFYSNFVYE